MSQKEEAVGGIAAAVFVAILIILAIFIWSPAAYFLGKWSEFWEEKANKSFEIPWVETEYQKASRAARLDCEQKVIKYFNASLAVIASTVSSTSEDFSTYDCYGLKFTKIK